MRRSSKTPCTPLCVNKTGVAAWPAVIAVANVFTEAILVQAEKGLGLEATQLPISGPSSQERLSRPPPRSHSNCWQPLSENKTSAASASVRSTKKAGRSRGERERERERNFPCSFMEVDEYFRRKSKRTATLQVQSRTDIRTLSRLNFKLLAVMHRTADTCMYYQLPT